MHTDAPPTTSSPAARRAVFIDVENSSRADHVAAMLAHLDVGVLGTELQILAAGNWRVVSNDTAALLSRRGATLLHTAPAFGVKDWSDLWIAVVVGHWLGHAAPGDILQIISDDQAFDAVGDVAAGLGVVFDRLSYRALIRTGVLPPMTARRPRTRGVPVRRGADRRQRSRPS